MIYASLSRTVLRSLSLRGAQIPEFVVIQLYLNHPPPQILCGEMIRSLEPSLLPPSTSQDHPDEITSRRPGLIPSMPPEALSGLCVFTVWGPSKSDFELCPTLVTLFGRCGFLFPAESHNLRNQESGTQKLLNE